jgi:hypothetical protein
MRRHQLAVGRWQSAGLRLWLVTGYCRLSGRWREYVRAESAWAAVEGYCLEHGMERSACSAEEIFELVGEAADDGGRGRPPSRLTTAN